MYKNNLSCPLNCDTTQKEDSQEHILLCSKLSKGSHLQWSAELSAETEAQAEVGKLFRKLMEKREHLLETDDLTNGLGLLSWTLAPSGTSRQEWLDMSLFSLRIQIYIYIYSLDLCIQVLKISRESLLWSSGCYFR